MNTIVLGNGLMGNMLSGLSGWDNLNRAEHGIDITVPDSYVEKIKEYKQVINCIGFTKTDYPFKEPSWTINYLSVMTLVDICNQGPGPRDG